MLDGEVIANITKDPVDVRDLHATILHLLGIHHDRLASKFQGLEARLTGVEPARVVKEIVAGGSTRKSVPALVLVETKVGGGAAFAQNAGRVIPAMVLRSLSAGPPAFCANADRECQRLPPANHFASVMVRTSPPASGQALRLVFRRLPMSHNLTS